MVKKWWKAQFNSKLFGLDHNTPEVFVRCQWQKKARVDLLYLTYRWLLAGYFIATMICSICDAGRTFDAGVKYIKWPIYLTNWGYTVCTTQAILAACLLTHRWFVERKQGIVVEPPVMSLSYKVYWVLNTMGIVMAIGITGCYWATVYDPAMHELDGINLIVHAFNTVCMVTDLFLVSHPFRLQHCYWPFLVTTSYVVFSVLYYVAGGTDRHNKPYVYRVLDWTVPKRTMIAAACGLAFVLTVHCAVWLLYLLRSRVHDSMNKKRHTKSDIAFSTEHIQISFPMEPVVC